MKRFTSIRFLAIVCMIVMGLVQTWAQENATVTVTPHRPSKNLGYGAQRGLNKAYKAL